MLNYVILCLIVLFNTTFRKNNKQLQRKILIPMKDSKTYGKITNSFLEQSGL